jgi:hypothetical protein
MTAKLKKTTTETQTAELTPINDNDAAALANVARELQPNDLVGLPLKFVKGKWFIRESREKEREIGATDMFVVDPLSYAEGWIRWQDKKPYKLYGRRVDGFVSPPRHVLPEAEEHQWPMGAKGPEDPWQRVQLLLLKEVATGELLTWQVSSWGGSGAIGEFLDEWAKDFKNHPGEAPVVILQSWDKPNADWGKIPTPRLKNVGWQPFGEGATPPGDPARCALVRQALLALPKPDAAPAKKRSSDMDDEIPF